MNSVHRIKGHCGWSILNRANSSLPAMCMQSPVYGKARRLEDPEHLKALSVRQKRDEGTHGQIGHVRSG